jgi:hypothetical protein
MNQLESVSVARSSAEVNVPSLSADMMMESSVKSMLIAVSSYVNASRSDSCAVRSLSSAYVFVPKSKRAQSGTVVVVGNEVVELDSSEADDVSDTGAVSDVSIISDVSVVAVELVVFVVPVVELVVVCEVVVFVLVPVVSPSVSPHPEKAKQTVARMSISDKTFFILKNSL